MEITNPSVGQIRAEITTQAEAVHFNVELALAIASCESSFIYDNKNKNSSAKGVYQFIDGTWDWIEAEGHQFDYKENIKQFLIWYQKYPSWWSECNKLL